MTLAEAARRLNPPSGRRWAGPAAIVVSDPHRQPDPGPRLARLPSGVAVLLRPDRAAPRDGAEFARFRAVGAGCRARRQWVMVSADWRLAARLGAEGLHLPEGMARHAVLAPALGWVRRRGLWLTVACHSPRALARARAIGADAALLSPVFATASHPGAAGLGPLRFAVWARRSGLAVIALGGLDAVRLRRLPKGSAAGVAAIGGW